MTKRRIRILPAARSIHPGPGFKPTWCPPSGGSAVRLKPDATGLKPCCRCPSTGIRLLEREGAEDAQVPHSGVIHGGGCQGSAQGRRNETSSGGGSGVQERRRTSRGLLFRLRRQRRLRGRRRAGPCECCRRLGGGQCERGGNDEDHSSDHAGRNRSGCEEGRVVHTAWAVTKREDRKESKDRKEKPGLCVFGDRGG